MSIRFLTPWDGLVVLAAAVPLAAWLLVEGRAARARAAVGLASPSRRARLVLPSVLVLVFALLGLAAAQPVLASRHDAVVSDRADVFLVLDTSRSMLAARSPGSPTRFERARAIAERLVRDLPPVPIGVASLTDRVLPHAFPTTDRADVEATLREAIGIERPPPLTRRTRGGLGRASSLAVLEDLADARYFPASKRQRIAIVLTDGESRPFAVEPLQRRFRQAGVDAFFVHVWDGGERVWVAGGAARDYRPDPSSGLLLDRLATALGGHEYGERDAGRVVGAVERDLGRGNTASVTVETGVRQLAPLSAGLALLPLAFLLWRRNLA